jgi:hypothetical protein
VRLYVGLAPVAGREVAIQIDAVAIEANVVRKPVGIGDRHDDNFASLDLFRVLLQPLDELLRNGRPRRLIAVDRRDEPEDVVAVAVDVALDRPTAKRLADDELLDIEICGTCRRQRGHQR